MDFSDLLLAKVLWPSLDESGAWGQTQLVPSLLPTRLCLRSGAPGLRPLFPSLLEAQSMMVAIRARARAASVLIPLSFITQGSLGCLR